MTVGSRRSTEAALRIAVEAGLPVAMRGKPGVGKTSMAEAVARVMGFHFEVVIGSLREPTDLAGLPIVQPDGTVALAPPAWATRAASASPGAVVLLDELTTASPAVQAAMLRVIRERVVGELALGESVRIVAAYNDARDCGGYELELPMRSRLLHLNVVVDVDALIEGLVDGWHTQQLTMNSPASRSRTDHARLVAGFLRARPSLVEESPRADSAGGYPCPRTWEMTIDALTAADSANADEVVRFLLVGGCVGDGTAVEFLSWMDALDLPDPIEILRNPASLKEHLSARRPDRSFVVLGSVVDVISSKPTVEMWSALVDVLSVATSAGFGDVVGFHAHRIASMRPAGAKLPASFSTIEKMMTSV